MKERKKENCWHEISHILIEIYYNTRPLLALIGLNPILGLNVKPVGTLSPINLYQSGYEKSHTRSITHYSLLQLWCSNMRIIVQDPWRNKSCIHPAHTFHVPCRVKT